MSLGKLAAQKIQFNNSSTAAENFLLKCPAGTSTLVISNGNDGSETDRITISSAGVITGASLTTPTIDGGASVAWTTYTPTGSGFGGTGLTYGGSYMKIGRMVVVQCYCTGTNVTTTANSSTFTLPAVGTPVNAFVGGATNQAVNTVSNSYAWTDGKLYFSSSIAATGRVDATCVYIV